MWKYEYLRTVLSFLLALILVSQLLRERRAPSTTMAWILVITFLPYVGLPLFLFLGGRKIKQVSKLKKGLYSPVPYTQTPTQSGAVERLLLSCGAPAKSDGNLLRPLSTGEEAYRTLLEVLDQAQGRIFITTFVLGTDPVGKAILEKLTQKAREGKQVRVLLDGMGSFSVFPWHLRKLRQAGGQVAFFLPLLHLPFFGHSNLRIHRKLVLVDGKIAIAGGMNLAREYLGPRPDPKRWVDFSVLIEGASVNPLEDVFRADWQFASGESLAPSPTAPRQGAECVQVVASGPDVPGDLLYDALVSAIFNSEKRVWIATPYFIPDETLSKALELAARRGVDVRIMIPKHSDNILADMCRGSYLKLIDRAGGNIHFHQAKMMHAKAVLIDDRYGLLGSANMDMRSLLLNFEIGVFLYSERSLAMVSDWFTQQFNQTIIKHVRTHPGSEMLDGLGRLLGPIL